MQDFFIGALEGTVETLGLICLFLVSLAVIRILIYILIEKREYLIEYFSTRNRIGRMHTQLRMLQRQKNRVNRRYLKIQRKLRELESQIY